MRPTGPWHRRRLAPTPSPTLAPTPTPTEAPSGGVEGATGTPGVTPPPTDTIASTTTPFSDGTRLLLLAVSGLIATMLLVIPARTVRRRR